MTKKTWCEKNHPVDYKKGAVNKKSVKIPPPPGMTQDKWDEAVKTSFNKALKKDGKRKYKAFGGDGGKTSGNCNSTTSDIIEDAGGVIPKNYNPGGLQPGLRTK